MTEPEERWTAYNACYEVSSLGNVRNARTLQKLKPNYNVVNNYASVMLFGPNEDEKKGKRLYVHRLVASAFRIPRREDQVCVDHINDNKQDNRLENLQWLSYSENNRKMWARRRRLAALRNQETAPALTAPQN